MGRDTFGDGWNGATLSVVGENGDIYFPHWSGPIEADETREVFTHFTICPPGRKPKTKPSVAIYNSNLAGIF